MIIYKTQKEIEIMAIGGKILSEILKEVADKVSPGIGTLELDKLAEELIRKRGGFPAFKNYKSSSDQKPFPSTLCTSINEEVVHGSATPDRILKEGDIIGLDIGMQYQGYFTDMAITVGVGEISKDAKRLIDITRGALNLAIEQVKEGNHLSNVAEAIQKHAEKNGFSVVRELVGHGVGKEVHEDPNVPNYVTQESKLIEIKKGMTIAIEPMVNVGDWQVNLLDDGWTFVTADSKLSAHFEHTVAVDHEGKTRILTQ
ncbi:type I methionyl aminopeptidase [Candidatus Falkowbacteria bacterium]|nr:type I methionyl aminopeptidase [Candidatus Falkowbacteria bacterium]